MQSTPETKQIRHLLELRRSNMLAVNPEYQRGAVWSETQKKKLIDSILRGYPIPLIYLHHIKTSVAGMTREDLEIVDGQQRLNAIYEFAEGAFSLFDPKKDEKVAKFPRFIREQECLWAGQTFQQMSRDLQEEFLSKSLAVVLIETSVQNEVRDLFVRLQSGLPLNAQETRDAWPGQFTDFVLKLGGKAGVARYPGHPFFKDVVGIRSSNDRGKARQLAAQIAVLFFTRRDGKFRELPDINSSSINDFYYKNIDFDQDAPDAKRLVAILDRLASLLGQGERQALKGHDAIHLVLLVDSLWDEYTRAWEEKLPSALDNYLEQLALAKQSRDSKSPNEFWLQYGQWTRVNSDRGERISHRDRFYLQKMLEWLEPLQKRDPTRTYGSVEKQLLYSAREKRCDVCGSRIAWDEAEVHHVVPHAEGGATILQNAALVHIECHPRTDAAVAELAKRLSERSAEEPTDDLADDEGDFIEHS